MSRIKGTKTKPELALRPLLKSLGFSYQPKGISGKPDFANRKEKIAIFVDGCFWHGCQVCYRAPKTNVAYWSAKVKKNMLRDEIVSKHLKVDGWRVLRVWGHQVKMAGAHKIGKR